MSLAESHKQVSASAVIHCSPSVMQTKDEFVRQAFNSNGLMFLFCVACGKLVAYSPRPEVLTIAESAHRSSCPVRAHKESGPTLTTS